MTRAQHVCFLLLLLILAAIGLHGQTPPKLAWDQAAPSAASAQGWTFRYYVDGGTTGTTLAGVACTGASSPFVCTATFPTLTPGPHTLQLTAAATTVSESVKSDLLFVNTPAPANVRTQ